MKKYFLIFINLLLFTRLLIAQGDGPRTFLIAPEGLWGLNPKWMDLNQNLLPSGNILIKNADIKVNVFPTTAFHTFGIKGRFAQILLMVNPGSASGTVVASEPGISVPQVSASGFSDGFIGFKLGLIGAPSLNVMDFTNHKPAFSMTAYFRLWYSGTYNSSNPLNLGTNRFTFELGFPLAIPFNENPKRATWLEIYPSLQIYTANNDPTLITMADISHQKPLLLLENHLTHNFTDKFWAGADLRYQHGGTLELDDVKQDNKINILGGGASAGFQFLPFLSANASYGGIMFGDNKAWSNMFRISLVFVYVNIKKP